MNGRMIFTRAALAAVLILMTAAVPVFAQTDPADTETFEGEDPFVRELALRLMERDWSMEQVRELVQASHAFQWSGLDPELADLTAYALREGLADDAPGAADSARVRAQLALELAAAAGEMERLGYEEQLVARAAAESVRSMNSYMNEWRKGENEAETGEMIRERVRERLMTEVKLQQQLRDKQQGGGAGRGAGAAGTGRNSAPETPIGP